MSPRGPNEKIIAIAVVNGGETSGSSTLASMTVSSGARQAAPRRGEREQEAQRRPDEPDQEREQQAVPERADLVPVGQHRRDAGGRERAVVGQHPREQHRQRIHDEEREQQPQREDGRGDGRDRCGCLPRAPSALLRDRGPRGGAGYGFSTSAIQRSTMRLRFAPA